MTVRIGILGTARIAVPALIEAATPVPEATVSGVAARDLARASGYAAEHGIPQAYGSYEEMLADPEIDAARAVDAQGDRGGQARAVREAVRVQRRRSGRRRGGR
jgi:hypothetical protein